MRVLKHKYYVYKCIVDDDIDKEELEYFNLLYDYKFKIVYNDRGFTGTLDNSEFLYENTKIAITIKRIQNYKIYITFKDNKYFDIHNNTASYNDIVQLLNTYLKVFVRGSKLKYILCES